MTIQYAIQAIIAARGNKAVDYAVNYALAAQRMTIGTEEFRTQLLYIQSNIVYWRGDTAKKVRQAIRDELSK